MNSPVQNSVDSSLLYLAIDLGPRPTMVSFGQEVEAINVLWSHCVRLALFRSISGHFHDQVEPSGAPSAIDQPDQFSLVVRRTRMESPWVTVLTTLAERSAPVAYGLGALWSLQRLLHMVMEWQRHRLDMELGRQQLDANPTEDELVRQHAVMELDPIGGRLPAGTPYVGGASVPETVRALRPVLDARMVNEGDDVP